MTDYCHPHPSEKKNKTLSQTMQSLIFQVSWLMRAGGSSYTSLGSGWFPKACGEEPRPSVNAPCSSLLSFKRKTIISYRKQGSLSIPLLVENCIEFSFYLTFSYLSLPPSA